MGPILDLSGCGGDHAVGGRRSALRRHWTYGRVGRLSAAGHCIVICRFSAPAVAPLRGLPGEGRRGGRRSGGGGSPGRRGGTRTDSGPRRRSLRGHPRTRRGLRIAGRSQPMNPSRGHSLPYSELGTPFDPEWGSRTYVMGIVNVTPDSFSGDGKLDPDAAVAHALDLAEHGADILDVGGESSRPGADSVDPEEELERVVPVIAR